MKLLDTIAKLYQSFRTQERLEVFYKSWHSELSQAWNQISNPT